MQQVITDCFDVGSTTCDERPLKEPSQLANKHFHCAVPLEHLGAGSSLYSVSACYKSRTVVLDSYSYLN
jgi:hypothetical protein